MKYDVFISYSRKDSAIANKICQVFDQQTPAISYFIDKQGIDGAADFPDTLAKAIEESSLVLFLGSTNSYQSDYVKKEVTYTISKKGGMSLFPLMLDNSSLPPSLEFQLSNINWRVLGKNYTIEEHLVPDIRKKLENPHLGETFEHKKHKKDYRVIMGAILSFCIILFTTLYLMYEQNDAKSTAIQDSERAIALVNAADSLLHQTNVLKHQEEEEERLTDELLLLDQAAERIADAQIIRSAYVGTEYLPLFVMDAEGMMRTIHAKKDSMYISWSSRAQDAYNFYRQIGSRTEKMLANRYADFALQIRPDDEKMIQLKNKINNK